jgi:CheY-like chemotaxis protein
MTKVLIVEDNPLNMELVQELLKDHGYVTYEAIDGEQALKYIEAGESFDLILMDIELPGINGVEVAKLIKAKYKNIIIIALTSYAMKGDKERFLAAGFKDYFSKPLVIEDFIKRLEKYKKH